MTGGPYRFSSGELRYVCLACYKHASIAGGLCPTCGVDLLSLDAEEVRADLHAEADRRMQKRQYAEYFGLHLVGFLLMSPLLIVAQGGMFTHLAYMLSSLGLGRIGTAIYRRLVASSALSLYARRNERLQAALTGKTQAHLPAQGTVVEGHGDPEDMSLDQTMRWLGMSPGGTREK